MKTTNYTIDGGEGFTQGDMLFNDSRFTELSNGLTSPFGNCILSGCAAAIVLGTWASTPGWIVINGELLYNNGGQVAGSTGSNVLTDLYWNIVQTPAAPSPVPFKLVGVQNVHFNRTAVLSLTSGAGTTQYVTTPTYQKVLAGAWNVVGAGGQPPFLDSWAAPNSGSPLRFRKNYLNQLIIEGEINGGGSGTAVFALPAGYSPSGPRNFIVYSESANQTALLDIAPFSGVWYVSVTPYGSYSIGEAIHVNLPPIAMD